MKRFAPIKWFRNVSIARKLYFTVGIMATLIIIELFALSFAINTLSSVRAYVNGEALWSKAQKDALYQLMRYARTHKEADYGKFQEFLRVPLGDHKALVEMNKKERNEKLLWDGLIQGRNDSADVDGMVKLFTRFHTNHYINKAIAAWTKADHLIPEFTRIAEKLHREIQSGQSSVESIDKILDELDAVNAEVTKWEDEFSYTLGEGSRWLERLILTILMGIAFSVELVGLLLAITVSRSISKGLDSILYSAQAVGKGDFSIKATVYSKDEIGTLANNFNGMAAELEKLQSENKEVNTNLEKKVEERTAQLERKNKELEQFAYVASHDLQEPLKTTSGFVELLRKQYRDKLDTSANKYIDYILHASERMQSLIRDLLDYSRLGRKTGFVKVDCNTLLNDVLDDLHNNIQENNALVHVSTLPVIQGYPTELKLLFQNLISNAIKFCKPGTIPQVGVKASKQSGYWQFTVSDNGIGIEPQHLDRIFVIFQRLHNRADYEGTGIGLAHCKKIVELHGGIIWVDSTPGKGSTFYFTLAETPPALSTDNLNKPVV